MLFNINGTVRVKLTEHGRQVLKRNHEESWAAVKHPSPPEYHPPAEDLCGWSNWQMWRLMEEFGPHIRMGADNCFELEIDIVEP